LPHGGPRWNRLKHKTQGGRGPVGKSKQDRKEKNFVRGECTRRKGCVGAKACAEKAVKNRV